jgi:hypothetical protein
MARKRTAHSDLPQRVYLKHGRYWLVHKARWNPLSRDKSEAIAQAAQMSAAGNLLRLDVTPRNIDRQKILAYTYSLLASARSNAKGRRGILFELTRPDVHRMLIEAGWKCAVTGTEFTLERIAGKKPFAPSIDRIDSAQGYTPTNCRIVCVAANYAMNVWGAAVLRRLLKNVAKQAKVLDMSNSKGNLSL